ncbi:MAG: hypothetical protein AUH81_20435 [Candidatus Rokubacteria bacterium 13_1_40CM_4_69_5]|nr:MAG: hypothetical protein AUH81_20435 [Candidatus Rokubacteria bacterium 13_1_40CM_4_69_5]
MLASWGVEFDPVDVQGNPAALAELRRLGVPRVPAVAVGDRAVHGWNPPEYARLLGVTYEAEGKLPPAELAARLDQILESTERLLRAIPDPHLDFKPPERDRSLRDLGYHVFRLSLAFIDAMDLGALPESWFQEPAPAGIRDSVALGNYGALVRARLQGWFQGGAAQEYAGVVRTYYGPQSGHELLERTAWHAGQHLRQLYALAERLGIAPPAPMPVDAFRGLPLPDALW